MLNKYDPKTTSSGMSIYEKFGRTLIARDERATEYIEGLKSLGAEFDVFDYEKFGRKVARKMNYLLTNDGYSVEIITDREEKERLISILHQNDKKPLIEKQY